MDKSDNHFDIVLVLEYFRSASAYLSIIKYLSKKYRIGLVLIETEKNLLKKTGGAHQLFVETCLKLGAQIVPNGHVTAKLMIIQQRPYSDRAVNKILSMVKVERKVAYMTLATAGMDVHDKFLEQFDIRRIYVPDINFFQYLIKNRGAEARYNSVEIVEVGLPFFKYPVFNNIELDYVIASPTQFSFHSEKDKSIFLKNVLSILNQIPRNSVVAYKSHNSVGRDYFRRRFFYELAAVLGVIPYSTELIAWIWSFAPDNRLINKVLSSLYYRKILKRVVPLSNITPFHEFSFELFLPGVKKGVIGGFSNTIWGSLYFGLPFYNCVDDKLQKRDEVNQLLKKSSSNLLDLNLGYFYIPCCDGALKMVDEYKNVRPFSGEDLIGTIVKDL